RGDWLSAVSEGISFDCPENRRAVKVPRVEAFTAKEQRAQSDAEVSGKSFCVWRSLPGALHLTTGHLVRDEADGCAVHPHLWRMPVTHLARAFAPREEVSLTRAGAPPEVASLTVR